MSWAEKSRASRTSKGTPWSLHIWLSSRMGAGTAFYLTESHSGLGTEPPPPPPPPALKVPIPRSQGSGAFLTLVFPKRMRSLDEELVS